MPITHRTELASCCPGELATSSIIMKALRGVSGVLSRGRSPGKLNHIKADSSGLGVVGSLVRQEPNNSVYLASWVTSIFILSKHPNLMLLSREIGLAVASETSNV